MKRITVILVGLALIYGCASKVHRGVVAMKISDTEAHVGLGSKEISTGAHVELYKNECRAAGPADRGIPRECKKVPLGHGEVTSVLSEDYSVVKFPDGVKFTEGDTIEIHNH